ncbi:hypothetical protein Tco_0584938 [Tanacetum coccineum]
MVACLEKTDGNVDFHQIVDFLTTSSIHHALTVSPTIHASYIEQFWATAKSKTVNDVKQIHSTVDGKTVVISESSLRRDLDFNDEDGIACLSNNEIFENLALMRYERVSTKLTFQKAFFSHQWKYLIYTILHCLSSKSTAWNEFSTNLASTVICLAKGQKFNFSKLIFDGMLRNLDPTYKKFLMYPRFLQLFLNNQITLAEPFNDVYPTSAHTKKVFNNMIRQKKDFSGRVTLLFASLLAPPVVRGEGSRQPSEPQPPSSTTQPIIEEQIQTSVHIPNIADEAVFKEWDNRVVRATTTTASLDAAQASGNITKTQSTAMSNDPLSQEIGSGDRPRSDEERIEQQDLTDNVPPTPHDSPLSGCHTPRSDEAAKESEKIGKGTKGKNSKNEALQNCVASAPVTTAGVAISIVEPRTPPTTTTIAFEDEYLTIAQTLIKMRSEKAKEKGVAFREVEESARPTRILSTIDPKDKGKGIMLYEDEQAQFEREQRIAKERAAEQEAKDAALIDQMEDVQARMDADALLAARLQEEEREQFSIDEQARFLVETIAERKSFEEIQKLYEREQKWINDFVPMYDDNGKKDDDSQHQAESSKKRPIADSDEERDDFAIDVESLATKYPIVDWKTHILTENMMYYQIIRADGSSKNYKIFSEMLDDFNKQDVIDLYRMVNERYETTSPEGYDTLLWGDLKTLFKPSEEDEIWRNQQNYNLISWRLFDSCGVHVLLMDIGVAIHMMIKKKYPLTQEMLSRMLNRRLEVDHESEMAFELLRFRIDFRLSHKVSVLVVLDLSKVVVNLPLSQTGNSRMAMSRISGCIIRTCYKGHRLDPNRIFPDIYEVPLNEKEHEIWLEFKEFAKGTAKLDDTHDKYVELGKVSIRLDHPIVLLIGNFAVTAFNKNWEMHIKKSEENHIHDFEFMECKYVKTDEAYYFFMTIEAIEEGNLGVYEAKVNVNINDDVSTRIGRWYGSILPAFNFLEAIEEGNLGVYEAKVNVNINDDVRITLSKFILSDRTPIGM